MLSLQSQSLSALASEVYEYLKMRSLFGLRYHLPAFLSTALFLFGAGVRTEDVLQDIHTMATRRASIIVSGVTNVASISDWYVLLCYC